MQKIIQTMAASHPAARYLEKMHRENRIVSMFGAKCEITNIEKRVNNIVKIEMAVVK